MNLDAEHLALVERARAGDKESMNRLAKEAAGRLHEFVYRQTLQEDLTNDIVQETIVEMLQVFNKLRHVERFWYWLYGIAYNKLRRHYSKNKRRRTTSLSSIPYEVEGKKGNETVADVVTHELRQIVLQAMETLDPRHRSILTMRCYDQMSYAEIAELMECTEFGARALFYRAKKSLAKKLAGHGLGKGALLTGLVIFGKMTATNEASAAGISIAAASLEVGTVATVVGAASSKAALVALTAGVLVTGTAISPWSPFHTSELDTENVLVSPLTTSSQSLADFGKQWYFYPDGPEGVLMMRTEAADKKVETRWRVLQNAVGNYRWEGDTIYQRNHRWYRTDLGVLRLPTDNAALSAFLDQMEGRKTLSNPVKKTGNDLLIVVDEKDKQAIPTVHISRHHNVLLEDYFQAHCPAGVTLVDERDTVHQRGWTVFNIEGDWHGQPVKGRGCIPFVYATLSRCQPWLNLTIGDLRIIDTAQGASIESGRDQQKSVERYPAGTFFHGLARPWRGLHVVDDIRRGAALAEISFQTESVAGDDNQVTVTMEQDSVTLITTIDLYKDLVVSMEWRSEGQRLGLLYFTYPNQGDSIPSAPKPVQGTISTRNKQGMNWLFALGKGTL